MTENDIEGARELLSQEFDGIIRDANGKCVRAGFVAIEAANGKVRIYHRLPVPDYDADTYPTSDELAEDRHRVIALYEKSFLAAGWCVRQRNSWSTHPSLLVSRQPW